MSKAEELAQESEALAEDRLEREGYEWSVDADVQLRRCAAELRRLAALEKAISDAEPVAWIDIEGTSAVVSAPRLYSDGSSSEAALYTLNGIKKP